MSEILTIVARIEARADRVDLAKTGLTKPVVFSTACTRTTTTRRFFCSTRTGKVAISGKRTWTDRTSPGTRATAAAVANFTLNEMTRLSPAGACDAD